MTRGRLSVLVPRALLWLLVSTCAALASEPGDLKRLFPSEADLLVAGSGGLTRLDLPPEVLSACRADLSDLRLFDRDGREIAFLVDSLAPPAAGIETLEHASAPLSDLFRSETPREKAAPIRRETFVLTLPHAGPSEDLWTLVFETNAPAFVARVAVSAIAADGKETGLVEGASLYRLASPRRAEKTRLVLPAFAATRLRVTLETEGGDWLAPDFRVERGHAIERRGPIRAPLAILSRERVEGGTIAELARPRGLVPDRLRLETTTGTFDRAIEVKDVGPGVDALLGSAQLFRVPALAPVEELELGLAPARGEHLRVKIDDGDSPPLENLVFTAIVRQPALIFEIRAAAPGAPAGVLRFGGGRARLPRYDLAGLALPAAGSVAGRRAEAAIRLYDPGALARATLGPVRANPDFDRTPALAFAMHAGAEIDGRRFSHRRPIEVPAAPEGLSKVRLAPADLAVLRDDLADLRIVDDAGMQWPYLLERAAASETVDLVVETPARRGGLSRYGLRPPVAPLAIDRILLETGASFFDRAFRLRATPEEGPEREIASGRLARRARETRPVTIDLQPTRIRTFELEVEDGDDAPLALTRVRARVPLPAIYLAAPAGVYALLLGSPKEPPPTYELARVRDVVLAVESADAREGPLAENPRYSVSARLGSGGFREKVLLWGVLIAAVGMLLALTLRLARGES